MTTAKELRIWANTLKQWINKIDDTTTRERLAQAAEDMERLAERKQAAERQLVWPMFLKDDPSRRAGNWLVLLFGAALAIGLVLRLLNMI
jgi:hypothetical protein